MKTENIISFMHFKWFDCGFLFVIEETCYLVELGSIVVAGWLSFCRFLITLAHETFVGPKETIQNVRINVELGVQSTTFAPNPRDKRIGGEVWGKPNHSNWFDFNTYGQWLFWGKKNGLTLTNFNDTRYYCTISQGSLRFDIWDSRFYPFFGLDNLQKK